MSLASRPNAAANCGTALLQSGLRYPSCDVNESAQRLIDRRLRGEHLRYIRVQQNKVGLSGRDTVDPITRLPSMMRNSQNLHHACQFAVDDVEVKNLETDSANIRRMDDARSQRHLADQRQGRLEFSVVAGSESRLFVLVPGNLLLVLVRCFRVQQIAHLRIA